MFYSHEVLTSRKYGVATVWLVATLGSNSSLKKVSRKSILDVDVSKACDTIVTPEAPMALRLQSNLLYGVTRVYAQQCGYVLTDVETARNSMRMMLKAVRSGDLEASTGGLKGRDEQVLGQDDPDFLPDLDLVPMDFDQLDLDPARGEDSLRSTLSPYNSQLALSQLAPASHGRASDRSFAGLMLPPSASPFSGGPVGGYMGGSVSARGDSGAAAPLASEALMDDDLGLVIPDDDGDDIVMMDDGDQVAQPMPSSAARRSTHTGPTGPTAHGPEQEERNILAAPEDEDFVMIHEDDELPQQEGDQPYRSSQLQSHTTSDTIEAPMRRRRVPTKKTHPFDTTIELRNSDLARWDAEYLANMDLARLRKETAKLPFQAKKNAELLMLGELGKGNRGPLSMFQGIELLSTLLGIDLNAQKRRHEDVEPEVEGRRVRRRSEDPSEAASEELARGARPDEDDYVPMMQDEDIEQGRRAPTPLDDHRQSSIMPWSRGGGSSHRLTFGSGYPRSASIGASYHGVGALIHRGPGSRLASASPLIGRGGPSSGNIDDYPLPPGSYSGAGFDAGAGLEDDEFELFGPAANVDTQTAAQSQWLRAVLDSESAHFLAFVREAIEEKDRLRSPSPPGPGASVAQHGESDTPRGTISFAQLLPSKDHGSVVAAQALLHVLSLGTKGVLAVEQPVAFGTIEMRVAIQVPAADESQGENESDDGTERASLQSA